MADVRECLRIKNLYDYDIKVHLDRLEVARLDTSELQRNKQEFKLLIKELEQFQVELNLNYENYREYVEELEVERQLYVEDFKI